MPKDAVSRVEAQERKPLPDALRVALREEGSVAAVARRFQVDRKTVYAWMRTYGVEVRKVVLAA